MKIVCTFLINSHLEVHRTPLVVWKSYTPSILPVWIVHDQITETWYIYYCSHCISGYISAFFITVTKYPRQLLVRKIGLLYSKFWWLEVLSPGSMWVSLWWEPSATLDAYESMCRSKRSYSITGSQRMIQGLNLLSICLLLWESMGLFRGLSP